MDQATFQTKWKSLPNTGELNNTAKSSDAAIIEQSLAQNNIMCMATGDLGTDLKFFFYAMDNLNNVFLAQVMVNKATGQYSSVIKGDDADLSQNFAATLMSIL